MSWMEWLALGAALVLGGLNMAAWHYLITRT